MNEVKYLCNNLEVKEGRFFMLTSSPLKFLSHSWQIDPLLFITLILCSKSQSGEGQKKGLARMTIIATKHA